MIDTMGKLLVAEIEKRLKQLKGWKYEKGTIVKDFERANFGDALQFVNAVGELAEKLDHHPDILLHNYKFAQITLTTHSEKGITEKDIALAKLIESKNSAKEPSSPEKRMWMQKDKDIADTP